ncbi:uncharacterized protein THITE_160936 [Thermothielavioides terrestris NRRL 8126]|uniref:Ecp2 effector protein domain-containing protein n=1 Tax=Thermothielavioides terrestris (strain ATCC 38088 / NRRL 8126) TaxID=578455 RepID=G2R8M0_THETT|nr:uncharacterized protein THITE_160936 [Thermothielavioides terrestris NRRL 8126]AEO67435.1 hypothetical protein THITE_160936 [Thermothielavioides terrestris NRRL 8126]
MGFGIVGFPSRREEDERTGYPTNRHETALNTTDDTTDRSAAVTTCDGSSYENRASPASPLVEDCLKFRDIVSGPGTCGRDGEASYFKVGNNNIRALIADSIDQFRWADNGVDRVAAKGFMSCDPDGLQSGWGIYHT